MGTPGSSSRITLTDVLGVFEERPEEPLTASEVAGVLDCARRTAFDKLDSLADRGDLRSKKTGARGRVWWRPVDCRQRIISVNEGPATEHAQFQELVQAVEDYAIFMLDPEGHVQSWNRGIKRIKGYAEDEIIGKHFSTFYTDEDREAGVPEANLAAAAEEGRIEDEGVRLRKDGSTFWANVVITALREDDGELHGFVKVTRDMTDQYEYEQQILEQRDELNELNRINADIRNIDTALVGATTREEIEGTVCERLAASASYAAAWIAEPLSDGHVVPRTWSGVEAPLLDPILDGGDHDDAPPGVERELVATALRTGAVHTARPVSEESANTPGLASMWTHPFASVAAVPLVYNDVEYGVLVVYSDDESGLDERQMDVLGEFGETISHAIAAVERKEREQTLTALHESTRGLLHAETAEEVGEVVVTTVTESLHLPVAVLYHFDTTDNVLVPLTASQEVEALDGSPRAYKPGDDAAIWTSFVDAETVVVERVKEEVFPAGNALGVHQVMAVPLGDHGVLVVGATEKDRFDTDARRLVELLAATTQAALTRVENEANLRERDLALQEQNRRLARLNQLNTIVREVDQHLVGATTREEIQRKVCELLTTSDRFRLAWIGELDFTRSMLTPLVWDGTGLGYLDSVTFDGDSGATDPAVRTARTGEITVVSNIADNLRASPWRKEALSREFQSAISVPLSYGDHSYGVLTVYADRPGMFDKMEQSVFAELGHTIATAINTVEMKEALFADRVIELEFRLSPDADSFLIELVRQTEHRIEFEGVVPTTDAGLRVFFTARDGTPDEVLDALERSVTVESVRLIEERDHGGLFAAVVSGRTMIATLVNHNASLRTLTATTDGGRVIIELPSSADVRRFIELFEREYPSSEFVARRERDRPIETPEGFRSRLDASLTDRQLEVLKLAYFGGYFDSPRGSTGGDIAEALDVSQPTVTTHLRAAQRKLLEAILDE